jgi:bifunctional DNA-binding transcriptional regulator/antitoxin component of YhaV-PrlF toxin-antitoxin module
LVIPAELRRKYGLTEGVRVLFEENGNGRLVLRASSFEEVYKLRGIGRAFPLDEALEEERRQARLREDNQ